MPLKPPARKTPTPATAVTAGRSWYRINYPYPRHPWPGGGPAPDWAKDRPTESDLRFLIQGKAPADAAAGAAAQTTQQ
ncbi:MAG: hypothetical protein R3E95_16325 [Thiolinea sp.]